MGIKVIPISAEITCDKCGKFISGNIISNNPLPENWRSLTIHDPLQKYKDIKLVFCEDHSKDAIKILNDWMLS